MKKSENDEVETIQKVEVPDVTLNFPVYQFPTLEEEVHFVCVEIRKLIKKGIPLSKIFLKHTGLYQ